MKSFKVTVLCLLIAISQARDPKDEERCRNSVSQIQDYLRDGLELIGKLYEGTAENVKSKHGTFDSITFSDATITGFEETIIKGDICSKNETTGNLEIK